MNVRRFIASLAALAVLGGCAQVQPEAVPEVTPEPTASEPEPSPTPSEPTCAEVAAGLTVQQQAGQLLMVGVYGTLDGTTREIIAENKIGSVILMGNYDTSVSQTEELTRRSPTSAR